MLYVIFRILFAVLLAVFLSRIILKVLALFNDSSREQDSFKGKKEDCIDICPECGRVRGEKHRCP